MILAANGRAAEGSLTKRSQSLQLGGKEKCHELGRGPPNEAPVWDKGKTTMWVGNFDMLVTTDRNIQKKILSKSKGKSNGLMSW